MKMTEGMEKVLESYYRTAMDEEREMLHSIIDPAIDAAKADAGYQPGGTYPGNQLANVVWNHSDSEYKKAVADSLADHILTYEDN